MVPLVAIEKDSDHPLDMDAPPDTLATLADGKDRQRGCIQCRNGY